jgi:membrane protein YqaA with SNARE-associated domain
MDYLHDLVARIIAWMESFAGTPHGHWALFAIAFAESSFFPIPPDVLLIALCLAKPELSFVFAGICAVGSVLGGMAGYGIGYYGGRPILHRLFNEKKVRTVEALYGRYNAWATGIAGLTPLPYKIFTIGGGAFSINFKIFTLASILSRTTRFMAVAALMYFFGEPIKAMLDKYLNVLSIVFVVLLIGGYWLVTRGFSRAGEQESEAETTEIDAEARETES